MEIKEKIRKWEQKKKVMPLIETCSSDDIDVRVKAIIALGKMRDPKSIATLIKLLKNKKKTASRKYAAEALGRIGDVCAVAPLIEALSSDEKDVRNAAADALGELGDKTAVAPLIQVLSHHKDWAAIEALGKLGDQRAIEPLLNVLQAKDNYSYIITAALKALTHLESMIPVDRIINALEHPSTEAQLWAVEALGRLGDKSAADPLIKTLEQQHMHIEHIEREALYIHEIKGCIGGWSEANKRRIQLFLKIIESLGKLGDKRGIQPLINLLTSKHEEVRLQAVKALAELGEPHWPAAYSKLTLGRHGDKRIVPALMKAFGDDPSDDADIIEALGMLGDPRAVELLLPLLDSKEKDTRCKAAKSLGQIGDERALAPLMKMLDDTDRIVQYCAVIALGYLGDTRAVEPLIDVMNRRYPGMRYTTSQDYYAAYSLGEIGDKRAVEPLIAVLENEKQVIDMRFSAARALGKIGDTRAVAPLINTLSTNHETLLKSTINSLGSLKDPRAIEPVKKKLNSQYESVREAAANALEKLGAQI
jgi:HEAT repeat protein